MAMACAMAWGLAACESDDTDFSSLTSDRWEDDGSGSGGEVVAVKDFDIDTTPLAESESFSADDNDYVENSTFDYQVTISYSGTTATLTGDVERVSVSQTGAHVVITSNVKDMEYVLTGASVNGSLKVYSDYKFKLTLNGVQLTNPTGAAINNQCGKTLYVVVADGTNNMLQDGTTYTMTGEEDQREAERAEEKCRGVHQRAEIEPRRHISPLTGWRSLGISLRISLASSGLSK